jgi:type IV pilus assembly protein PilY1
LTATRVSPSNSSGNEPVHNRLYAFRDYNYATGAPGTVPSPLSEANLYDATANQIGTDTGSVLTTDLNTLSGDKGWYINLKALSSVTLPNGLSTTWIGEKVLAPTEVVQGVLLATTYTPANNATTASACQVTQGTALEYALNALNATPATGVTTSSGERAGGVIVGSGIPSQVVIVFRPDGTSGLIDAGNQGGVPTAAQGVQNNSVKRNYWYEE